MVNEIIAVLPRLASPASTSDVETDHPHVQLTSSPAVITKAYDVA
jgi:hypothetical protein